MAKSAAYYKRMFPNTRIEGFEDVMNNLNRELKGIKVRSHRGTVLAAAVIRRATETTPPLTPVDLGNLRASWFTVTSKGAVSVEEAIAATGTFKGPQQKKLEEGHRSTKAEAQAIVSAHKDKMATMLGYTAHYALYVHEGPGGNPGAHFKRPGAGIKWFEAAVKRNTQEIVRIIRDNAKVQ